VLRGGSWFDGSWNCRSSRRVYDESDYVSGYYGFRAARNP
jgi:formylglycine-generating enzyme required for sulfatase activity